MARDYTPYMLALVLMFFIVGIGIIVQTKAKGTQCLIRPLETGTEIYEKATGAELTCTCSFNNPRFPPFIVTKNGTTPIR